jgi:iron-sulfur cluster insertion protein
MTPLRSMATLPARYRADTLPPPRASRRSRRSRQARDPAPLGRGRRLFGLPVQVRLGRGVEADDTVAETDGVRLVVDSISLDLVRGAQVDFVDNLGGAHFAVTNPNAASGCGCGTSFSV